MRRSHIFVLLAGIAGPTGATTAAGGEPCTPALAVKEVHFSQMQAPTLERKWTAVVSVGIPLRGEFRRLFRDRVHAAQGDRTRPRVSRAVHLAPAVGEVGVDFAADEAVDRYRIENITPCSCGG
jgi:hypothetical protein